MVLRGLTNDELVSVLLDGKADINAQNSEGMTALEIAKSNNKQSIVRLLLRNDAKDDI